MPLDIPEHPCYIISMRGTEAVIIKIAQPTTRKARWLENIARVFSQAVGLGLDAAKTQKTHSRGKLHKEVYRAARDLGLPADYARMAVNAALALARSHRGLRSSRHTRKASFPKVNGSQGIGLGVNAYAIIRNDLATGIVRPQPRKSLVGNPPPLEAWGGCQSAYRYSFSSEDSMVWPSGWQLALSGRPSGGTLADDVAADLREPTISCRRGNLVFRE